MLGRHDIIFLHVGGHVLVGIVNAILAVGVQIELLAEQADLVEIVEESTVHVLFGQIFLEGSSLFLGADAVRIAHALVGIGLKDLQNKGLVGLVQSNAKLLGLILHHVVLAYGVLGVKHNDRGVVIGG